MSGRRSSSSLNARRRREEMERLAGGEPVDVVVIGGGITGAGVALDAASRGLRVALVERRDLANGTSRWSSKLVHGGLRYLRHLQVDVAWESARERDILMRRTAPHLVRPLRFVIGLDASMPPALAAFTEAGVRAGDALRIAAGTPSSLLPHPRRVRAEQAVREVPAMQRQGLRGAIEFWDGQLEDDARLVIAVARTAAARGARILTYCEAIEATCDRVRVRDALSGASFDIRTAHTVNATGIWAGRLAPGISLRPSKGVHVVVRSALLKDPGAALVVPVHGTGRWVFVIPASDGLTIIGTTDDAYGGEVPDEPGVSDDEATVLLAEVSPHLERPLRLEDVIGRYAGFRPLLSGGGSSTADLSRKHAIVSDPDTGVVTVVGGKLTTYRHMAEQTVDRVAGSGAPRSRTATLPLVGAAPPRLLQSLRAPGRLVRRYGAEAPAVASLGNGWPELLDPVARGVAALGVELVFGVEDEGALTVADLLDRRVRLGLVPAERAAAETAAEHLLQRGLAEPVSA
ncbi:MAG: glycerol-3-phosphate dehydrogenase/oxidase [Candidatus Dormibacteraeota bacterium]|nr:glycerol-3-phosphate dehydrogenase/oxidase [Candidatus Dormibacteraeota bacterium]